MKKNNVLVFSVALIIGLTIGSHVSAQSENARKSAIIEAEIDASTSAEVTGVKINGKGSMKAKVSEEDESVSSTTASTTATTTATTSKSKIKKTATSTGSINGQLHRSEVATFVQTLLHSADRLGGIGEQVRVIAHEQASSTEVIMEAMAEVENESKIKTFFFGPDYKNLGAIRSEIVQTENRLAKLTKDLGTVASSTDATTTAEVSAEIKLLQESQVKLESFVQANESKFSLFGWARKFFQN